MLTTSREPLALIGEAMCPLPPLTQPPVTADAPEAAGFPAVQLWLDRARVVRPDFVLDAETVGPVIEIVRRLDGLPLAIELAAARLRVLPAAEIAAPALGPVPAADRRQPAGLPRHRTLRAVVEWSWDLLSAEERLLAERLAVFPAGADSAGATVICADHRLAAADIDSLLISLVDKSLLQAIEATDQGSSLRFRMLETIREYGVERLAERAELEPARLAHARYFADLTIRLEPALRSARQLDAMHILDVERENILAALRFLGDSGRPLEALAMALALNLVLVADRQLERGGDLVGFRGRDQRGRPAAGVDLRQGRPGAQPGDGGGGRGRRQFGVIDWESAIDDMAALTAELVDAPPAPYPGLEALRPMVAHFARRPDLADAMIERGARSPDRWVRAALLATAAFSAENDSDVAAMCRTAGVAYEEFCQIGDRWGLSSCLLVMARLATLDERIDDAAGYYDEAWQYLSEIGASNDEEIYIRIRIADLYARQGEWEKARRQINDALQRGDRPLISDRAMFAESTLAQIDWMSGDLDAALELARDLRERLADRPQSSGPVNHLTAVVLATSGALEAGVGRFDQAKADLRTAYAAGVASGDMPILCIVGLAAAAYAVDRQEFCAGAVILGATAQIRGAEDPGDPTVIMLTRRLRAGCPGFESAFAQGWEMDRAAAIGALDPDRLETLSRPGWRRRRGSRCGSDPRRPTTAMPPGRCPVRSAGSASARSVRPVPAARWARSSRPARHRGWWRRTAVARCPPRPPARE